ncbi:hypothetical protein MD484_g1687, partial [Candolleomyces efflorescens]
MEEHPSLKGLVQAIVTLNAKSRDENSSPLVGKCADFCVCLFQYVEEENVSGSNAVNAVEEFCSTVNSIESFDYNCRASLTSADEVLEESIRAIKSSHPSLEAMQVKERAHGGLSGTAITMIDIGIPVVNVLKDAVEIIGVVSFLKPVLGAVLVLSQAARQTQSNFDEMLSLSRTAAEVVITIAERCATIREIPPDLEDAVKKLERHSIACNRFTLSRDEPEEFRVLLLPEHNFEGRAERTKQSPEHCSPGVSDALERIAEEKSKELKTHAESGRLKELPTHPDMSGILPEYLVESRTPDVEEITKWIEESNEVLLCIHGTAGVGKSTLAAHLSRELRAAGRLAGAVYLGAVPTDTSGPETIIKMLAHEIGKINPRAIPKILEAIQRCHATSLDNHVQKYILEPLQSLTHPHPLVIIVDALDEWRDHPKFIQALGHLNSNASVVKVIGTMRLNPVASHLPGIAAVSVRTYHLAPVSVGVIKAYLEEHLQSVPWVDGRRAQPPDIEKLAELSGGLPIWAATVISLLSHSLSISPPHEILADIVGSRRPVGGSDRLGDLYDTALEQMFKTLDTPALFRQFFGAIVILQAPLSISHFSELTGIPRHLIENIQPTSLFHLSLIEHLLAGKSGNPFAISASKSHSALALSCMRQLRSLFHMPPSSNLQLRAIQAYSVKYWTYHASNGTPRSQSEWSQTEHRKILQMLSVDTQHQWARLFHKTTIPGDDELALGPHDNMVSILKKLAYRLGRSGGDQWTLQVACLEVAVRIDHGDKDAWTSLGGCYRQQGERMGGLQMYEEALAAYRQALILRPESDPNHADSLINLSVVLRLCYQLNGSRDTLDEAILTARKAVAICPASDPLPSRARSLITLANVLVDRYTLDGDLQTLHQVISLLREAVDLLPAPHSERATALNNLANCLDSLHQRNTKDIGPLNEAISLYRNALPLHPASHPLRHMLLLNLANSLRALSECNADEKAMDEAISLEYEALVLVPAPHPDRSAVLNNLGNNLKARYDRHRNIFTLKECLSVHREALGLRPAPHPYRPVSLDSLASALLSHFDEEQQVEILNEAISLRRELREIGPPGRTLRNGELENLLLLLERRRDFTGKSQDDAEIEDVKAELAAVAQKKREGAEKKKMQEQKQQKEQEEERKEVAIAN